jgi:hypothetical protein
LIPENWAKEKKGQKEQKAALLAASSCNNGLYVI